MSIFHGTQIYAQPNLWAVQCILQQQYAEANADNGEFGDVRRQVERHRMMACPSSVWWPVPLVSIQRKRRTTPINSPPYDHILSSLETSKFSTSCCSWDISWFSSLHFIRKVFSTSSVENPPRCIPIAFLKDIFTKSSLCCCCPPIKCWSKAFVKWGMSSRSSPIDAEDNGTRNVRASPKPNWPPPSYSIAPTTPPRL